MGADNSGFHSAFSSSQQPAIRFLVESALRRVITGNESDGPRSREEWVDFLTAALTSESETSHENAVATMMANGVSSDDLFEFYVPAVARRLGELWVKDEANFVEVTVGAARLQALFGGRPEGAKSSYDGTIPFGEPVLMTVPDFEDHALGAFVAADQFRRHGLWVHMGIGLSKEGLAELLCSRRFSLVGITSGTWNTLEKVSGLVDYLRAQLDDVPPIVIGGRVVTEPTKVIGRTGADLAVTSVREAVEVCGLSTVGSALTADVLE